MIRIRKSKKNCQGDKRTKSERVIVVPAAIKSYKNKLPELKRRLLIKRIKKKIVSSPNMQSISLLIPRANNYNQKLIKIIVKILRKTFIQVYLSLNKEKKMKLKIPNMRRIHDHLCCLQKKMVFLIHSKLQVAE